MAVLIGAWTIFSCSSPEFSGKTKVTGTYSNVEYIKESGDLLGYELKIVATAGDYEGALQVFEGAPSDLYLVKIKADKGHISFQILNNEDSGDFRGRIDKAGLTGEFNWSAGGKSKVYLPRRKGYWD